MLYHFIRICIEGSSKMGKLSLIYPGGLEVED